MNKDTKFKLWNIFHSTTGAIMLLASYFAAYKVIRYIFAAFILVSSLSFASRPVFAQSSAFTSIIVDLARQEQAKTNQRNRERIEWYRMNQNSAPTIGNGYQPRIKNCHLEPRTDAYGSITQYVQVCN